MRIYTACFHLVDVHDSFLVLAGDVGGQAARDTDVKISTAGFMKHDMNTIFVWCW